MHVVIFPFNRLLGDDGVSGAAALANTKVSAGDNTPDDSALVELKDYDDLERNLVLSGLLSALKI